MSNPSSEPELTSWVFVIAGQSNAVGRAKIADNSDQSLADPYPDVQYAYQLSCYSEGEIDTPCNGEQTWRDLGPKGNGDHGPELTIGRSLNEAIGDENNRVYLLVSATGGSDLHEDWHPDSVTGRLHYPKMIRFYGEQTSLLPGKVKFGGTFWIQGERDAQEAAGGPTYADNLSDLLGALDSDLGHRPFVSALLSDMTPAWTYKADVNAALSAGTEAVNTDGLEFQADATHYSSDGYAGLGQLMADAMATLIGDV